MKLPKSTFMTVVKATPLVSIDFVIERDDGCYLFGQRRNAPAKGYWFNLGGRILKNETVLDAMDRQFVAETGCPLPDHPAEFLGVFDHIYDDNVFGEAGFGTHYICLAYKVCVPGDFAVKSYSQHSKYKWFERSEIVAAPDIHENTKICFRK